MTECNIINVKPAVLNIESYTKYLVRVWEEGMDVNETFAPAFESLLNTLSLHIFFREILLMGFGLEKNAPIYKIRFYKIIAERNFRGKSKCQGHNVAQHGAASQASAIELQTFATYFFCSGEGGGVVKMEQKEKSKLSWEEWY